MKKQLGLFIAAMGISMSSGAAFAQAPGRAADRGAIEVGFRVAYGLPTGKQGAATGASNDSVSDELSGIVPFVVEGGYRFDRKVYLGVAFQYAPGIVNVVNNVKCNEAGVACSGRDLQLSVNLLYHLAPEQAFDAWFGIGAGYEWMTLSVSADGATGDLTAGGFQFANLQAGGDIRVAPSFAVGPFLSLSFGQFRRLSTSGPGTSMDVDITDRSFHQWILLGARGAFDIHL